MIKDPDSEEVGITLPRHRSSAKRRPAVMVVLVAIFPLCSQNTLKNKQKINQAPISAFVTVPDSVHKNLGRQAGRDGDALSRTSKARERPF